MRDILLTKYSVCLLNEVRDKKHTKTDVKIILDEYKYVRLLYILYNTYTYIKMVDELSKYIHVYEHRKVFQILVALNLTHTNTHGFL